MTTTILTKASKIAGTVIVEAVKLAFTYYVTLHIIDDTKKIIEKIRKDDEELIDLTESAEEEAESSIEDNENIPNEDQIVSDFIRKISEMAQESEGKYGSDNPLTFENVKFIKFCIPYLKEHNPSIFSKLVNHNFPNFINRQVDISDAERELRNLNTAYAITLNCTYPNSEYKVMD